VAEQGLVDAAINHVAPMPVVMMVIGALFLGTLAISRISLKFGVPAVLGVLLLGLAINPRVTLFTPEAIQVIHTLTLAVLVFYAGLRTELKAIRGFLRFGLLLAFGGVVISTLVLGLIVWFTASPDAGGITLGFEQIPLGVALLVAVCLGSTDAGATMNVLDSVGRAVPQRLRHLVEFESSVNDPAAILLLGIVLSLFTSGGSAEATPLPLMLLGQLRTFVQQIGSGVLVGLLMGLLASACLNRLVRQRDELLLLGISLGLLSYGSAELLQGSGLLSVYVTGLFLCNVHYSNSHITPEILQDTLLPFNTMTEITVFLIYGINMRPSILLSSLSEGVVCGLGLMLIARPLSVIAFQHWSPFNRNETTLICWCGLRGAVPLSLSISAMNAIPGLPGIDPAMVSVIQSNGSGIVFTVVVLNLLLQGLSLPHLCRLLGMGPASPAAVHPSAAEGH
jgi:cell volume regulation protein A